MEALRYLAEKFCIEAPELDERSSDEDRQRKNQANLLYRILGSAQEMFSENLASTRGEAAREYLIGRGFSRENLVNFGFGLTPEKPWELTQALTKRGFSFRDIEACSLATSGHDGKYYDFFRNRIMIPIRDTHGRVIAFGGRTTDNNPAKYINSRETLLYDKSSVLFGFDKARNNFRARQRAILVEGYMDTLQLWQHGFGESVACLGTSLSVQHLRLLKLGTNAGILLFDGDAAGQKASLAAVTVALQVPEIDLKVAVLPTGEDPDTFLAKNGAEAMEKLLAQATGLLDFAITSKLKNAKGLAIPELVSHVFIPWLLQIKDPMQRSFLSSKVSHFSGISLADLQSSMRSASFSERLTAPAAANKAPAPEKSPKPLTLGQYDFEMLAHVFYSEPGELDVSLLRSFIVKESGFDQAAVGIFLLLLEKLQQGLSPVAVYKADKNQFAQDHPDEQLLALLDRLVSQEKAFLKTQRGQAVEKLMLLHKQKKLRQTITSLKNQVATLPRDAEGGGDFQSILQAIAQLNKEAVSLESRLQEITS